jgi:hypothetical protein
MDKGNRGSETLKCILELVKTVDHLVTGHGCSVESVIDAMLSGVVSLSTIDKDDSAALNAEKERIHKSIDEGFGRIPAARALKALLDADIERSRQGRHN